MQRLREEFGVEPLRADVSRLGDLARECDAMYLTPQKPHQLSLFTDAKGLTLERVDALYMTRPQTERYTPDELQRTRLVHLGKQEMAADSLREAVVMHPLPRRDEISADMDSDPRSIYFKQAARGVPIRMAILGLLLGRMDLGVSAECVALPSYPVLRGRNPCANPTCISRTESRHVTPSYRLASRAPVRAYCLYCSQEIPHHMVGCSTTGLFHERDSSAARKIRPDHLVFLRDEADGLAQGFSAAARATLIP
jgi:hypothetical protein